MTKTHLIADETIGGIQREYVEVDRKANVGNFVVITDNDMEHGFSIGEIKTVEFVDEVDYGVLAEDKWLSDEVTKDYRTLEPTDVVYKKYKLADLLAKCTLDRRHEESPPYEPDKVFDLLANLARRVTSLESQVNSLSTQLRDTQRNIETFAQQTEHNSEDIRTLDERTQVIGAINNYYGGAR